jgi:hypothetical protein
MPVPPRFGRLPEPAELEKELMVICRQPRGWWIAENAHILMGLDCVRSYVAEGPAEAVYADAVRSYLEFAVTRVPSREYRTLLMVILGLRDERWQRAEWRARSAQERRAEAGQLFRGEDGPVASGTIRQIHQPRAVAELARTIAFDEKAAAEQSWPGLLGPDGLPLIADSPLLSAMAMDVRVVTADLVKILASQPELLYSLAPRQFEEVVAELLDRRGYDITLTPASKDGGVDIFAAKREAVGTFLYVVECKRYSPHNRVGVGLIQKLVGAIAQHRATAGMLATTSFFTVGARELERQFRGQVSLKDYADVSSWLDARGPGTRSERAAA